MDYFCWMCKLILKKAIYAWDAQNSVVNMGLFNTFSINIDEADSDKADYATQSMAYSAEVTGSSNPITFSSET